MSRDLPHCSAERGAFVTWRTCLLATVVIWGGCHLVAGYDEAQPGTARDDVALDGARDSGASAEQSATLDGARRDGADGASLFDGSMGQDLPGPTQTSVLIHNRRLCATDGWCWERPAPHGLHIPAVYTRARDDLWVGGDGFVFHYAGGTWQVWELEAGSYVRDFWGEQSTPRFAALYGANASVGIYEFDGARWQPMALPERLGVFELWGESVTSLMGLAHPIGTDGLEVDTFVLLRFDGTAWQTHSRHTSASTIYAAWGPTPNAVRAVGSDGTILRFNGTQWASESSGSSDTLQAIWGTSANDIWAGGGNEEVLRYDGTQWRSQPLGVVTSGIREIWGRSPSDVYALTTAFLFHYDGTAWQSSATGARFLTLSGNDTQLLLGGRSGYLMVREGGMDNVLVASSYLNSYNAVWASSATDVYAGDRYALRHYDGTAWTTILDGVAGNPVGAIHGLDASKVLIGARGAAHLKGDSAWTQIDYPAALALKYPNAAWMIGADHFYLAFSNQVATYEGGWQVEELLAPTETIASLWGDGAGTIYAAGRGAVMRKVGTQWEKIGAITPSEGLLWSVTGSGPEDIWAWANADATWHYDGTAWRLAPLPIDFPISAATSCAPGELLIATTTGQLYRWAGSLQAFHRIAPGVRFTALWCQGQQAVAVAREDAVLFWNMRP